MELQYFGVRSFGTGTGVFSYCNALRELALPRSLTSMAQSGFIYAAQTKPYLHIYVYQTTPPSMSVDPFNYNYITIYVPAESVDTYKAASGWSRYASKIQPMPSQS